MVLYCFLLQFRCPFLILPPITIDALVISRFSKLSCFVKYKRWFNWCPKIEENSFWNLHTLIFHLIQKYIGVTIINFIGKIPNLGVSEICRNFYGIKTFAKNSDKFSKILILDVLQYTAYSLVIEYAPKLHILAMGIRPRTKGHCAVIDINSTHSLTDISYWMLPHVSPKVEAALTLHVI